jgi:uncharacterized membrane protein YjgN (DUF898 family)
MSALPATAPSHADLPTDDQQPEFTPQWERFSFSGTGSEYFRIWIVNLLLTIVTLGIYSAWAKVRKLRYMYDSTQLAGSSFEYHGNPIAILKGRIVAVIMLVAYNLAFEFSLAVGLTILVALGLALPWLLWKSQQFKLFNSSFRGIRFGFRGNAKQAYSVFLMFPVLALVSLYLLLPLAHQRIKKFQHSESRFGHAYFSFQGSVGGFYKTYAIGFLIALGGVVALGLAFSGTLAAIFASGASKEAILGSMGTLAIFVVALYLWLFMLAPIFLTMIQKLIWNNTRLGEHQFKTDIKWTKMAFIMITNVIGIVLTLGLFTPFAQIRAMRYRVESMSMLTAESLDNFVADTQANVEATGEGMADMLDFDLSL